MTITVADIIISVRGHCSHRLTHNYIVLEHPNSLALGLDPTTNPPVFRVQNSGNTVIFMHFTMSFIAPRNHEWPGLHPRPTGKVYYAPKARPPSRLRINGLASLPFGPFGASKARNIFSQDGAYGDQTSYVL